jgi:putative transposase
MARLQRVCLPGVPLHIVQRGNNRQACFTADADFAAYAHWLAAHAETNGVAVHAWVFMPNHVHLLVTPDTADGASRMMQTLGRQYVRYFNREYRRTGTLWEGRFRSCVVDTEAYLLTCQRYIELNPVRAGLAATPDAYAWSSYRANGLGRAADLWTPHPVYEALGTTAAERTAAYRRLFAAPLGRAALDAIRKATHTGTVLGGDAFRAEIERRSGLSMVPRRPGPKGKRRTP